MKENSNNQTQEIQEVAQPQSEIATANCFAGDLPDLNQAEAAPLELNGEYWTPQKEGETRRMFFNELRAEITTDMASGKDVELLVAYFVEVADGAKHVVRQASRRLTAVLEARSKEIVSGTPLQITYLGKIKNKTNSFMSDAWSIKPLIIKAK